MTIEEKLREMILERDGTIVAFSKRTGIPNSTIYTIFSRGINKASVQNILKICEALGISADALAEGKIMPRDQYKPTINIDDWLQAEKLHLMNVNITINGELITEAERLALWEGLALAANFIQKVKS